MIDIGPTPGCRQCGHSIRIARSDQARGGSGGRAGGTDGLGLGGGVFADGLFEVDATSLFFAKYNRAADEGDNFFGDFTEL